MVARTIAAKTPVTTAAAKKLKSALGKKSTKVVEPLRKQRKAKEEEEEESEDEDEASEEEDEDEQGNESSSEEEDSSSSEDEEDEDMGLSPIPEEPHQSVADALKIKKAPKKKKAPKTEAQEKAALAAKARGRKRDALERRLQREKFVEGREAHMPIKDASCVTAVRRIALQMDGQACRVSVKAARLLLDHVFKSLVCLVLPEVREIQMPASKWTDAYKAQKQVRRSKSRALVLEQVYKRHLRKTDFLGIDSVETMNVILERFATNTTTLAREQAKQESKKRSEAHAANVARAAVLNAKDNDETITDVEREELIKVTLAIEEVEKARTEKKRNEIKANIKMQEEAAEHIEKVSLPARLAELRALDGDGEKSASHISRVLAECVDARDELKTKVDAKDLELRALLDDKKKMGKELHTEETLAEIVETKAKIKETRKRFKEEGTLSIGREVDALVEALGVLQATLNPDATALNDQIGIEKKRLADLRKRRNEAEKALADAQRKMAAVGKNHVKWTADVEAKKARIELHRKTAAAKRIELKEFEKQLRGHKQSIKLAQSLAAPMEE